MGAKVSKYDVHTRQQDVSRPTADAPAWRLGKRAQGATQTRPARARFSRLSRGRTSTNPAKAPMQAASFSQHIHDFDGGSDTESVPRLVSAKGARAPDGGALDGVRAYCASRHRAPGARLLLRWCRTRRQPPKTPSRAGVQIIVSPNSAWVGLEHTRASSRTAPATNRHRRGLRRCRTSQNKAIHHLSVPH